MPRAIPAHRTRRPFDAGRSYERQWGRAEDKAFYCSASWIKLRDVVRHEEPLCRKCKAEGRVTPTQAVDHILDRKARPDLALVRSNMQGLCKSCHNAKRRKESR